MSGEPLGVLLAALRIVGYGGYLLWAGPLVFWTLVWPAGRRHRQLLRLSGLGAVLLIFTSLAEPMLRLTGGQPIEEVAPPLAGAAVLVRLAILVASLFYLVDLVSEPVVGGRRAVALAAVVVVAGTAAVQPAVLGQPGPALAAVGTVGHLLAAATWLGGLVALAAVVRPAGDSGETSGLVTRFFPVATLGLVLLVAASGVAVLAGAVGGGAVGPDLALRFALLVALLLVAWYAHRATARLAFRRLFSPPGVTGSARVRTLALVVGVQLVIAFVALSAGMAVTLGA